MIKAPACTNNCCVLALKSECFLGHWATDVQKAKLRVIRLQFVMIVCLRLIIFPFSLLYLLLSPFLDTFPLLLDIVLSWTVP